MACDSFGVNSHSVLALPPSFSFQLSISQQGLDISIGTNRQNCKQVHSRNHCRLSCHNPILIIQTQTPRYCCGLSQFSVIVTVISHLCQELILCKSLGSLTHVRRFRWNKNLSGALNCRFLFQHCCLILTYLFRLLWWQSGTNLLRNKRQGHWSPLCGNLI